MAERFMNKFLDFTCDVWDQQQKASEDMNKAICDARAHTQAELAECQQHSNLIQTELDASLERAEEMKKTIKEQKKILDGLRSLNTKQRISIRKMTRKIGLLEANLALAEQLNDELKKRPIVLD